MKIGILTLPLIHNYGGLLQAYALKEVLSSLGHQVIIINRHPKQSPLWRKYASVLKSSLIGRKVHPNILLRKKYRDIISEETSEFRKKYLSNLSTLITSNREMLKLNDLNFDVYIVGSDQCWRPEYTSDIRNNFLDFAVNDKKVKRIAYAASFGVSKFEYNQEDAKICSTLLKKFDAVSVREDSGVDLLNKYFNRNDAEHVLDPTMLLSTDDYNEIIRKENVQASPGNMNVYVLDKTQEKKDFISLLEKKLKLKKFEVMPSKRFDVDKVTLTHINDFKYPNPAVWLRGFQDAEYVVTDSFHGTVFSILYNVPFISIGNKGRGMSRFQSLLKIFGMEDRLVTDFDSANVDEIIQKKIDWNNINRILAKERDKSLKFIYESLE